MLEMRTSERDSLKKCPQQWYWSQVEGLRPNIEATPLWFGSAVHEGLAAWYLPGFERGPHPVETFEKFLEGNRSMVVYDEESEGTYVDARELGIDMLTRYVDLYGTDPSWNVVATEHKGEVILPRPEMQIFGRTRPARKRWLRYNFTWDGIYRDEEDGQLKLMEHKTAASIRLDHLPLDDQAGSYWAVASALLVKQGVLKPGEEIVGINYNFLRKAMQDQRPRNADGYYTNKPLKQHYLDAIEDAMPGQTSGKETIPKLEEIAAHLGIGPVLGDVSKTQPAEYFVREMVYRTRAERRTQIQRIQEEAVFAEAYRGGLLPIVKAPDKQRCSWCKFKRMCELDESGDQDAVESFKETQFHTEDPYLVYQKSTDS